MATQITKPQVEIVPSIHSKELEVALTELHAETEKLPVLREKAKAIEVTTPAQFADAGQLLNEVRAAKKIGGFKIDPFKAIADRVVTFLRTEKTKHENAAQEIDAILSAKMSDYTRREREAAQREQDRINEERRVATQKAADEQRKADEAAAIEERKRREKEIAEAKKAGEVSAREAERLKKEAKAQEDIDKQKAKETQQFAVQNVQDVRVQPNTPKVAGQRQRIVYCFEIIKPNEVDRAFLCPDDQAIGAKVRSDKNPEKSMMEIGGIRVWSEDRV